MNSSLVQGWTGCSHTDNYIMNLVYKRSSFKSLAMEIFRYPLQNCPYISLKHVSADEIK